LLDIVTLKLPPSPTRPDALNVPPAEASCRFSIAIVKLAPLGQLDEIRTFQWPSEPVDASAGEVEITATACATRHDQIALLKVIAPSQKPTSRSRTAGGILTVTEITGVPQIARPTLEPQSREHELDHNRRFQDVQLLTWPSNRTPPCQAQA
jgi:hypothetical protein